MLTFTDMSGVFYCVLFGMASSLLVLLVELFIEAHKDTKQNNKEVLQYTFKAINIILGNPGLQRGREGKGDTMVIYRWHLAKT